jgi:hypothetical protein
VARPGPHEHPLTGVFLQDNFEDASEITPRPDSHSERPRSSRSLLNRPDSAASTPQEGRADSPVPEVPALPKDADTTTDTPSEDAAPSKSPLLTAHRISVTSDMDDVSLDGGECSLSFAHVQHVKQCAGSTRHPLTVHLTTAGRAAADECPQEIVRWELCRLKLTWYRGCKGLRHTPKTTTSRLARLNQRHARLVWEDVTRQVSSATPTTCCSGEVSPSASSVPQVD